MDYDANKNPDVLIIGSSHMFSTQIPEYQSTGAILNELYSGEVYTAGASGHLFLTCTLDMKLLSKKYRAEKYIIIETPGLNFKDNEIINALNGKDPRNKSNNILHKIFYNSFLAHNSYLRLMHRQMNSYFSRKKNAEINPSGPNNAELLDKILQEIKSCAESSGTGLIIAYHPPIILMNDGKIKIDDNPENIKSFSELCKNNNIYFLNTGRRFLDEYAKDFTLPYGFINTSVGKGHLNKYGHRMFAEEIYKFIQDIEAQS